jgi:flavin-binding protein dodecin
VRRIGESSHRTADEAVRRALDATNDANTFSVQETNLVQRDRTRDDPQA